MELNEIILSWYIYRPTFTIKAKGQISDKQTTVKEQR